MRTLCLASRGLDPLDTASITTAAPRRSRRGRANLPEPVLGPNAGPNAGPRLAQRHQSNAVQAAARPAPTSVDAAEDAQPLIRTGDGAIRFVLRRTAAGVCVERSQHPALNLHLTQFMLFDDLAAFNRWCDADPVRFAEPLTHQRLRRLGQECFHVDG